MNNYEWLPIFEKFAEKLSSWLLAFCINLQQQSLIDDGRIRQFKLGVSENDYAVMLSDDYRGYVVSWMANCTALCKRLTQNVLPSCKDVSISKDKLTKDLRLSQEDIS